ncbi:PREDICTED: uncharacterized protein LOC103327104 [Prunus mume]|uniref:Uncharacterized protein LOC103327104 n=1 Tax=Prunus mume TaxID=102107 RepID=A0ABM1LLN3_PRUMU|nr:PREDICTED: uncharacterized protein LOC103327104 [Prunus mume]
MLENGRGIQNQSAPIHALLSPSQWTGRIKRQIDHQHYQKMLEKNPKQWHEKLSETLWAYRTSKSEATGTTPYALTYGHDAILPMEIAVQSLRIAHQHNLVGENYSQAMLLELEGLDASTRVLKKER